MSKIINKRKIKVMAEEASKEKQKLEHSKECEVNKLSEGALCGEFYIGMNKKVRFSKGNLQFNAVQGTHKTADGKELPGIWRFAEHQWDTIGDDNEHVHVTYDGFVDLFGWGTSGWDSGAEKYQPWSNSPTDSWEKFCPGEDPRNSLTGQYENADWGRYNAISNGGDTPGQWRTLTAQEWKCLLKCYNWTFGTIDGIFCFFLIPENVSGIAYELKKEGDEVVGWESNTFTAEQFEKYEDQGVVAFPCGGCRCDGATVYDVGSHGNYWLSSLYERCVSDRGYVTAFRFSSSDRQLPSSVNSVCREIGRSVRLVQDVKEKREVESTTESTVNKLSEGAICGEFYIGLNRKVRFSKGNLQFNAVQGTHKTADGKELPGTWRFAEHQWNIIGKYNVCIGETYDGFVDLFGWGTSGWNSGADEYQPWSFRDLGYGPGDCASNNLTGAYANADWGVYNAISNGGSKPNKWRTLTKKEWNLLFFSNKWSMGTIDGMLCFLLIPEKVTDLVVLSDIGDEFYFDESRFEGKEYESNTFTAEQFKKFEDQGVVALPCGGCRRGVSLGGVGSYGYYWSSSAYNGSGAYDFYIHSVRVELDDSLFVGVDSSDISGRLSGCSVRLVQDV